MTHITNTDAVSEKGTYLTRIALCREVLEQKRTYPHENISMYYGEDLYREDYGLVDSDFECARRQFGACVQPYRTVILRDTAPERLLDIHDNIIQRAQDGCGFQVRVETSRVLKIREFYFDSSPDTSFVHLLQDEAPKTSPEYVARFVIPHCKSNDGVSVGFRDARYLVKHKVLDGNVTTVASAYTDSEALAQEIIDYVSRLRKEPENYWKNPVRRSQAVIERLIRESNVGMPHGSPRRGALDPLPITKHIGCFRDGQPVTLEDFR